MIPSHEFAGVVAEVGPGVIDLAVGDSVFGIVPFDRDGAAAEPGAEVTVTVTSESAEAHARSLGADHVIVAGAGSDAGDQQAFDVAIDAVGAGVPEWLYASVRPGGRLVVLQEPPSQELADKYGVTATFLLVRTRREKLEELAAMIAAGQVEVAIAQTFPLSAGRAAYESGALPKPGPGKTVLLVR